MNTIIRLVAVVIVVAIEAVMGVALAVFSALLYAARYAECTAAAVSRKILKDI